MGPVLPGGMSFTVNRVPLRGGGVPSSRAPMSSTSSPTEMSAGVPSLHQMRVDMPPDFDVRRLAAVPSMRTFAVRLASCPVTTRRIGGKSVIVKVPGFTRSCLLRLLDARQGRGSFAHDDQPGFLVLGAVPMHLLGEMRDERAGGHRYREIRIELVARGDPPGALDHGDEAIVRMKVRAAEVARPEPVHDHVQAGFFRIADEHRLVDAGGSGRVAPLELI